jgi:hypothetical protein
MQLESKLADPLLYLRVLAPGENKLFTNSQTRRIAVNLEQFVKNRNAFPTDELSRYTGQHVAWSPDGARILASDRDPMKVISAVKALGFDPADTPIEDIPSDEVFPGGGFLFQGSQEPAA